MDIPKGTCGKKCFKNKFSKYWSKNKDLKFLTILTVTKTKTGIANFKSVLITSI